MRAISEQLRNENVKANDQARNSTILLKFNTTKLQQIKTDKNDNELFAALDKQGA
jgi:hypothetical protein